MRGGVHVGWTGLRATPFPAVAFVRVVLVASRRTRSAEAAATPEIQTVELHVAAGARLRCAVGTDPRWLADLVVACQKAAC